MAQNAYPARRAIANPAKLGHIRLTNVTLNAPQGQDDRLANKACKGTTVAGLISERNIGQTKPVASRHVF